MIHLITPTHANANNPYEPECVPVPHTHNMEPLEMPSQSLIDPVFFPFSVFPMNSLKLLPGRWMWKGHGD